MEFRVLGPLEVVDDGRLLDLGGARQRALLAVLLVHANHVVSRDRLADELFGEEPRAAAANLVQVYVSRLRSALEPGRPRRSPGTRIVTRAPGYLVRVEPDELDLHRFERLAAEGRHALAAGEPALAAERLRAALDLWRGPPLAEFAYERFAAAEAARLEELRLVALEDRIDAGLAAGEHAALAAELRALVAQHPLRERLRGQLMLALYRSGRQAEALEAYSEARTALLEGLGLDPGQALQDLERAILRHDPALEPAAPAGAAAPAVAVPPRVVLALADDDAHAERFQLAARLSRGEGRELLVTHLVAPGRDVRAAAASLNALRPGFAAAGVAMRATAFTADDVGAELLRLLTEQDVELLVLPNLPENEEDLRGGRLGRLLSEAPCDVAVVANDRPPADGKAVLVPFGGKEHDWAALELGARLAAASEASLLLLGPVAAAGAKRDASRLLARASLVVQRLVGVPCEPLLTAPGPEPVVEAAAGSGAVVVGFAEHWRDDGIGQVRRTIAARAPAAVVVVHRGVRPGGLAPPDTLTRFTWSLAEPA